MNKIFILIISVLSLLFCWEYSKIIIPNHDKINNFNIYTGLDVLELSNFELLENKKVGLVINQTSVNRYNSHILDLTNKKTNIKIKKIFTPEHGLKGKFSAGEFVKNEFNFENDIEIISLYGKNKKPKREDLIDLDIMIYDIQDIGSRYYTYISTMTIIMETCAENNLPFLVLDRPNPLGGEYIRGPILEKEFSSFVGMHPIPIVHGMTSGELAIMINELNWINKKVDLTIVPVINWQRSEEYNGSLKGWIPPSPNIPDLETAKLYSGLCLLEGTNLSEGRGTYEPFKYIGAPFIEHNRMKGFSHQNNNNGISFSNIEFTPQIIEDMSKWPKFENKNCNGLKVSVKNDESYDALKFIVEVLIIIHENYPYKFKILDTNFIDNLYGSDELRYVITKKDDINILFEKWSSDEKVFRNKRAKFLIYN